MEGAEDGGVKGNGLLLGRSGEVGREVKKLAAFIDLFLRSI